LPSPIATSDVTAEELERLVEGITTRSGPL
jgi:hypothetical protein